MIKGCDNALTDWANTKKASANMESIKICENQFWSN